MNIFHFYFWWNFQKAQISISFIRLHIIVAVLVLQTTFGSIAYPSGTITGYSDREGVFFIDNNENWNYWNESTNVIKHCSSFDCGDTSTLLGNCPTELTVVASDLKTVPNNLFVNCFKRLNILNLSKCGIEEIHRHRFENADNLIRLDLSYNQITSLTCRLFKFAPKVELIDLSHNRIGTIDEYAFENCTSLKQLGLSNNSVLIILSDSNWLVPLKNLEVLNLNDFESDGNGFFFFISEFHENVNLVSLYAKNSRQHTNAEGSLFIDVYSRFPKLKHLIISRSIDDEQYRTKTDKYNQNTFDENLAILDISGKGIRSLPITANFKIVIANDNQIRSHYLRCSHINHKVTELYLSNNQLTDMEIVTKLPNLEIADFSSNHLQVMNEAHFMSLAYLVELNLANNLFRVLELDIIRGQLPSLKLLDISHNNLKGPFELNSSATILF